MLTSLMSKFCPKGTMRKDRNTGITTKIGPRVKSPLSALAGTMSSLKTSFKPSATGCNTPKGPAYSGPIRCWTAAEILRSSQTTTNTPTVAPMIIRNIGRGIQMALAAPGGMPNFVSVSIKLPWRSIPEFICLFSIRELVYWLGMPVAV